MNHNDPQFIKLSHDVIERNGIDAVRRWASNPNTEIANTFRECLQAVGEKP